MRGLTPPSSTRDPFPCPSEYTGGVIQGVIIFVKKRKTVEIKYVEEGVIVEDVDRYRSEERRVGKECLE